MKIAQELRWPAKGLGSTRDYLKALDQKAKSDQMLRSHIRKLRAAWVGRPNSQAA